MFELSRFVYMTVYIIRHMTLHVKNLMPKRWIAIASIPLPTLIAFETATLTKKTVNVCLSLSLQVTHFSEKHLHLMSYYSEYSEEICRNPTRILELLSVKVTCSFITVTTPLLQRRTESRLKMIANQYGNTFESFENLFFKSCLFKWKHILQTSFGWCRFKWKSKGKFICGHFNSSVHFMIYTLSFDQFSLQTKGSQNKNNHSIL